MSEMLKVSKAWLENKADAARALGADLQMAAAEAPSATVRLALSGAAEQAHRIATQIAEGASSPSAKLSSEST